MVYYEDASSSYSDEDESTKLSSKEMAQWAIFFSEELVPQDKNNDTRRQNRIKIRNASLLKKIGANQWAFSHPSLRDYFLSLNIIGAQSKPHLNIEKGSPMIEPVSPRPGQSVIERFRSLNRRSPRGISHRMVGSFFILNRFDRKETDELRLEERMHITFEPDSDRQKLVLGQGSFGKLRIGQHSISHRFQVLKRYEEKKILKDRSVKLSFNTSLMDYPTLCPSGILKS